MLRPSKPSSLGDSIGRSFKLTRLVVLHSGSFELKQVDEQLWCHLFQIEQKKTYPRCRKSFDSLDFAWCEDVVKNWDLWLQVDDLLFVRHQPQEGMGPVIELALELTQQFLRPLSVPSTQPLVLLMFNLPGGLGRWDWLLLDLGGSITVFKVKGTVISCNF